MTKAILLLAFVLLFNALTPALGDSCLSFPENLKRIEEYAFYQDTSLHGELDIPSFITYVGAHAFDGCTGITTVRIYGTTEIDPTAFEHTNAVVKQADTVWHPGDTVYFHVNAREGSGVDLYTRYLIEGLSEVCPGVNFAINNYQSSSTGMSVAINANPDGLNLGTSSGSAIVQWHTGASDISLKDDAKIVGIMNLGSPQAIIAGFDAPYKNFNELAEYIKANPGQVHIGCSMGGTTQMIFTSFVEAIVGDKDLAMYVQCASEADRLTNVASGALDIANCSIPNALAYENDGRLNVLGTIGPNLSTLSTMSELLGIELSEQYASGPEQGFNDATWESNYYVFAPADTPDAVCRAINEAICKANETASYLEGNRAMMTFVAPVYYNNVQVHFQSEWTTIHQLVNELGLSAR